MNCEQCNTEISDNLAGSITTQQEKVASDPENKRLICIACFCSNGMKFECPKELRMAPLPKEVVALQNEEREKSRKEKRVQRKKQAISTGAKAVPNGDDRTVARWDISKNGRIGKPVGIKNSEGYNCWACPICNVACERKYNFPGRSLDDVVHHMLEDGCYARFLAEESV